MPALDRASNVPGDLSPVPMQKSGLSGRVALALVMAVLVAFVGISLVEQTGGGRPGSQAAMGRPTATIKATAVSVASSTATPAATPSPTAPPEVPLGTPPPWVGVPVGPVTACPAGSTPDKPGPVDQARPPLSFATPMAFDRRAGRIVVLAGGTWTFDVCTNTWTRMGSNPTVATAGQLVYDVDSDVTIMIDGRNVWAYDLTSNRWTAKGVAPWIGYRRPRLAYDPVSGLVVLDVSASAYESGPSQMWTYDVETDTWAAIRVANPLAAGPSSDRRVLAYDASVDRLIAFADQIRRGPWLFDRRTGRWATSAAAAPEIGFGWWPTGGEIAYDEATERIVVFSGGRMVAYDAAADSWEVLWSGDDPAHPEGLRTVRFYHTMVYDPVNQRLVVYGGEHPTSDPMVWVQSDDVIAFDPATRQWSVPLEASTVQPVK